MNRKTNPITALVVFFTLLLASLPLTGVSSQTPAKMQRTTEGDYYETVVSIPVKSGTFEYQKQGREDTVPAGPNSLSVSDDNSFLISNSVDNSVTELAKSGDVVGKFRFDGAVAISDAIKRNGEIVALDQRGDRAAVVSSYGYKVADAPADAVAMKADDSPGSLPAIRVQEATGRETTANGVPPANSLTVSPGNPFLPDARRLRVWRGKAEIVNRLEDFPIAETRLLGSTTRGDFFVVVFELIGQHAIVLDQKVLHFGKDGKLQSQARVPQEQSMPIVNDTALAPDGSVFVLMPRNESLDILKLHFKDSLNAPPIQELAPPMQELKTQSSAQVGVMAATTPTTTRQQIANIANWYFGASVYVPVASITGTCRKKPGYITTAKYYPSVPYSWGGSDTPTDFYNKMSSSSPPLAGHVANYYSTCSRQPAGVDCSGFAAQAWGMAGHPFSTSTVIGGYASTIDWTQLKQGDALVWPGSHIVLFARSDNNTVWTWEATGDAGAERALAYQRSWSYLRSYYTPIRYKGLSITQPTARMTAQSNFGILYEYSTGVYNVSPGQSVHFVFDSGRSSANVGSIDSRTWKINNTTVSTAQSFSFNLGRGTHNIALTVTNTDGGIATSNQQIVVNEVVVVPPPRISYITPSTIRPQVATWLHVIGSGFASNIRAQVRTPAGGPWQIASSGVSYVNSGELWVNVNMGYGTYTATLELVNPNGVIASGQFVVRP